METNISIIICTYNRADSLKDTLSCLVKQSVDCPVNFEILVVNNNSNDHTEEVVKQISAQSPWPVRHVFESQQGISYARNRGIQEAAGDYLLFTDDDTRPCENWIQSIYETFRKHHADVVGGKILPLWAEKPAAWIFNNKFKEHCAGIFAIVDYGEEEIVAGDLDRNFFFGANMSFRREVLQEVGPFRTDVGAVGKKHLLGEDTDILEKVFAAGKKIVYSPRAVVQHKIPAHRMTLKYARRWRFDKGYSVAALTRNGRRFPESWLIKECLSNGIQSLYHHLRKQPETALMNEMQFWNQWGQISAILDAKK